MNKSDQLEEVIGKSVKLIEQTWVKTEPKIESLLSKFSKWLDSKLEYP